MDDLSAANVDAEVLKLGTDVATQFREISQLLRNAELRRKARAAGSPRTLRHLFRLLRFVDQPLRQQPGSARHPCRGVCER